MTNATIEQQKLLDQIDGSSSSAEHAAVNELRKDQELFTQLMFDKYKRAKKARERSACVHYTTKYAKESQAAYELGITALCDKSRHTRHLACLLLAWSLRSDALGILKEREKVEKDTQTLEDIRASIDSIENNNSNYFVDREHSGMMTLNVL